MVYMIDDRAFRPWDDDLPFVWEMAAMCEGHWSEKQAPPETEFHDGQAAVAQADGDSGD